MPRLGSCGASPGGDNENMKALRIGSLALVPSLCALAGLGPQRVVSSVALALVLGLAIVFLPQPRPRRTT